MGEPLVEWSYGDIDAGFAKAALVLDETFVTAGMSHHSMEPRSAMAYWENGKCFVFGSTQSQSFVVPGLANLLGITPNELVYVAETCGGGFGSKGTEYPVMAIPAHMSKKIGRPVMLRITRAEEYFFGYARTGFQGRIRMGFDAARPRHGRRSLRRARERRDGGLPRLAVVGRDRLDPLSAAKRCASAACAS